MIKLIIFDLDGVLVEAKGLHFDALNKALGMSTLSTGMNIFQFMMG
jgi:beta-phosphoglucomutase-like phosphatase (HAD superfamily)